VFKNGILEQEIENAGEEHYETTVSAVAGLEQIKSVGKRKKQTHIVSRLSTFRTGRRVKVLIKEQPRAHVAVRKAWLRMKPKP
jgi:hypothetical protein